MILVTFFVVYNCVHDRFTVQKIHLISQNQKKLLTK